MTYTKHPGDLAGGHRCSLRTDHAAHGIAVDTCSEDLNGRLWVDNGEYASQVFFCPVCGMKARTAPADTPPVRP